MTRIGHSLPLLCRLPSEPYGESADDAIGAFRDGSVSTAEQNPATVAV